MAVTPFHRSIAAKILATFLAVGLLFVTLTGWQSYETSRAALEQASFERLTAVRETKKRQIETYFSRLHDQVRTVAGAPETSLMLRELTTGFLGAAPSAHDDAGLRQFYEAEVLPRVNANVPKPLGLDSVWPADPLARHWQSRYISGNGYAVGAKDNLIQHNANSPYDLAHAKAHRVFRPLIHRFGFYDMFLVDARTGHVVYTVFKEIDFGTNLLTGPHAETSIGKLFRDAVKSADPAFTQLVDYTPYVPSYGAPAAFIGAPVFDGDNKVGVVIMQVPVSDINRVMTGDKNWVREGLGTTGETYLVGADKRMRTDSRFLIEDPAGFVDMLKTLKRPAAEADAVGRLKTTILNMEVATDAVTDAVAGASATRLINDYRNEPVLSSWTPLSIQNVNWVLLSEIDAAEAFAPIATLRRNLVLSGLVLLIPLLVIGWLLSSRLTRDMRTLKAGIIRVRSGALDARVDIGTRDELAAVADAFNDMAGELKRTTVSKAYVDGIFGSMNDPLFVAACVPGTLPGELEAPLMVTDANACVLRLLGCTLAQVRGLPLRDFAAHDGGNPGDPLWTLGDVLQLAAKSPPQGADQHTDNHIEGRLLVRGRAALPVTISLSCQYTAEGHLERVIVVAHDITEQKKARDALSHANSIKDAILANTSHELRTPLNGIIGIAGSLAEGAAGRLTNLQLQNVEMMGNSARRLAHLVNDLLDFSSLRHRTLELRLASVDLRVLADIAMALSSPQIGHKPVTLYNEIPANAPLLMADEDRLQQILLNLLGNAIKFTPEGSITLTAEVVGDKIALRVRDTGIGIAADHFERIFESFEQGDGSTQREYGGTGLGLAITRQLVELHGGQISVTSTVGRGSEFTITLPTSKEARTEANSSGLAERLGYLRSSALHGTNKPNDELTLTEDAEDELSLNRGVHVLAVDDEPVNLQVLKNYLGLRHYNVTTAESGQEALDLLASGQRFDLVILDVMMPRMSGYECCRKIRLQHSTNELPILMLTAKNQVNDLVAGFEAGANDYLAKPFSGPELISRVRTHVQLGRVHSATGRFVPHEFLGFLNRQSLMDVQVGDKIEKRMSVLFADIRGFTAMSEGMSLHRNFDFVNEFLGKMEPCIREHKGFIDKFIGDAIMALFDADGDDAVEAALSMLTRLELFNIERASDPQGDEPVHIGIGIHTGSLVLGTVGTASRLDHTVISDSVNIASRVEGLTKAYDVSLLITGQTRTSMRNRSKYPMRIVDCVHATGKTQVTELWEVIDADRGPRVELKKQTLAAYEQGFAHYRRGQFTEAIERFETVLLQFPDDKPARVLLDRCRRLIVSGVPVGWDGVASMAKEAHAESK